MVPVNVLTFFLEQFLWSRNEHYQARPPQYHEHAPGLFFLYEKKINTVPARPPQYHDHAPGLCIIASGAARCLKSKFFCPFFHAAPYVQHIYVYTYIHFHITAHLATHPLPHTFHYTLFPHFTTRADPRARWRATSGKVSFFFMVLVNVLTFFSQTHVRVGEQRLEEGMELQPFGEGVCVCKYIYIYIHEYIYTLCVCVCIYIHIIICIYIYIYIVSPLANAQILTIFCHFCLKKKSVCSNGTSSQAILLQPFHSKRIVDTDFPDFFQFFFIFRSGHAGPRGQEHSQPVPQFWRENTRRQI